MGRLCPETCCPLRRWQSVAPFAVTGSPTVGASLEPEGLGLLALREVAPNGDAPRAQPRTHSGRTAFTKRDVTTPPEGLNRGAGDDARCSGGGRRRSRLGLLLAVGSDGDPVCGSGLPAAVRASGLGWPGGDSTGLYERQS